ncbi:sulfatase [Lentisphaera profundi]|uniref:Sulfatase n=1 Tax=Lentisphaera profundi TaxID=1658616 RepID=A0ABY7VQL2_9BACT|nr:sulfatase [Lentisphaera profundi]WDE95530.1 sulfatase [Lentisphaera profundi]
MNKKFLLFLFALIANISAENKYNVVMICVDDLRNELGCYGVEEVISPNFDRLASESVMFDHHYVQIPTCGASRYALLTGQYPTTKASMGNGAFKQLNKVQQEGAQSLPELFRRSGYVTSVIGKVSHTADGRNFSYNGKGKGDDEVPFAWDWKKTPFGEWKRAWGCFFAYANGKHREDGSGYKPRMEFEDVADNELPDGMNTDEALRQLDELKDKRFFLSLGFYKPHLPFVAPKKYWDMYEGVDIKLAKHNKKGYTAYWHGSGEFYKYQGDKTKPLSEKEQLKHRRAYYACISYVDAQIGRVMDKLKELNLDQNTVVVLWSDHGWHLGDHQMWGKHNLHEQALASPLMIKVPGTEARKCSAVVETVDIFPTLKELCQTSFTKTQKKLSGQDLGPILFSVDTRGRDSAFSFWKNAKSVRTKNYRLIVTQEKSGENKNIELYDHRNDPDEIRNVARENPEVVSELLKKINKKI